MLCPRSLLVMSSAMHIVEKNCNARITQPNKDKLQNYCIIGCGAFISLQQYKERFIFNEAEALLIKKVVFPAAFPFACDIIRYNVLVKKDRQNPYFLNIFFLNIKKKKN